MKIRGRLRIAAGFAAAMPMLWALPASGQSARDLSEAQQTEMYCVQDALAGSDDAYDLADVYLAASEDEATLKAADAVLQKYLDVCAAKHSWSAEKTELAGAIGMHGAVVEVLSENLWLEGLEGEEIDTIFAETGKLSQSDLNILYTGAWKTDDAFRERIVAQFIWAGLPDDDYVIDSALEIMQAAIAGSAVIAQWVALVKR